MDLDMLKGMIRDYPVITVGISAALGFLLGLLI